MSAGTASRPGVVGVVGTLVWDTIHTRDPGRAVVEEWGGIAYGLGALSAAIPSGWSVRPLLKVGRDLSERAGRYLSGLPGVDARAVQVVPEPNNRVELRYQDADRRTEHMSGGVPPWTWPELEPLVRDVDALYVNYVSGFETTLETAVALRSGFSGPIYMDLHSLFLGVGAAGLRTWRALPEWSRWIQLADVVQMNEMEFELIGRASGDPWALAAQSVGKELGAILVTLGPRGAAFVRAPDFDPDPMCWRARRESIHSSAPTVSGRAEGGAPVVDADPTGCGDVWGATCFATLLAGASLEAAMDAANRAARRNAALRGAEGLHLHLGGRLSLVRERRVP